MASSSKDEGIIAHARTLANTPWCEEYEKMISGMLYNPLEQKLCDARHRARVLAHKYNNIDPGQFSYEEGQKKREEMLKEMLGHVGEGAFVEPPFIPDYGSNVSLGKFAFINFKYVNQEKQERKRIYKDDEWMLTCVAAQFSTQVLSSSVTEYRSPLA